jgi:hypothetical protein
MPQAGHATRRSIYQEQREMECRRGGDTRNMTNGDQDITSKTSYLLDGPVDRRAPLDPTDVQRTQVALL